MQRVREKYVQPVDSRTLMQRAAGGMVMGLDEYSTLLDPGAYEDMKVATSGSYAGVGIEIESHADHVSIARVIGGSPADRAGLLAGDVVESIDGVVIDSHNLEVATAALRGETGTAVALGVRRNDRSLMLKMQRARVELASVRSQRLQPGFGYIRISSFTDSTAAEFSRQLRELRQDPARPLTGLVIDLRNNPGGVLDAAVVVADELLESGVIVSADGRSDEARFIDRATPGDASGGAAITVLVNGGSASAAEILAAALHDNARALLVGRRTYGKGSVQTIMPLSGGRALKLTTSRYYTPAGVSLDHNGIVPDVELSGAEFDPGELDAPGSAVTLAQRDPEVGVALQRLRDQLRLTASARPTPTLR
jgi:carboxyl-terminal processing protease